MVHIARLEWRDVCGKRRKLLEAIEDLVRGRGRVRVRVRGRVRGGGRVRR